MAEYCNTIYIKQHIIQSMYVVHVYVWSMNITHVWYLTSIWISLPFILRECQCMSCLHECMCRVPRCKIRVFSLFSLTSSSPLFHIEYVKNRGSWAFQCIYQMNRGTSRRFSALIFLIKNYLVFEFFFWIRIKLLLFILFIRDECIFISIASCCFFEGWTIKIYYLISVFEVISFVNV